MKSSVQNQASIEKYLLYPYSAKIPAKKKKENKQRNDPMRPFIKTYRCILAFDLGYTSLPQNSFWHMDKSLFARA